MQVGTNAGVAGDLFLTVRRKGLAPTQELWRNQVTRAYRDRVARHGAGVAGTPSLAITQIACGVNGSPATLNDTEITGAFTKALATKLSSADGQPLGKVSFGFLLAYGDAVGMGIREFGLYTADGLLAARVRRPDGGVIAKDAETEIEGAWQHDWLQGVA